MIGMTTLYRVSTKAANHACIPVYIYIYMLLTVLVFNNGVGNQYRRTINLASIICSTSQRFAGDPNPTGIHVLPLAEVVSKLYQVPHLQKVEVQTKFG